MGINLVKARKRKIREQKLLAAKIQSITLIGVIIYAGLLLGLMSWHALENRKLSQVERDIGQLKERISELSHVQAKQELIQQKIALVDQYMSQHRQVRQAFLDLYGQLPEGLELTQVTYGEAQASLKLTGNAADVFVLSDFLDQLETFIETNDFERIEIDQLFRHENATYRFETAFGLNS